MQKKCIQLILLWLKKNFVSACITKAQIVTYLSMVQKFTNLKHSEIVAATLCLGNISKDWSIDNMKKTGFNWYVYDTSVDYNATDVDDIVHIHKYLMKNNDMV